MLFCMKKRRRYTITGICSYWYSSCSCCCRCCLCCYCCWVIPLSTTYHWYRFGYDTVRCLPSSVHSLSNLCYYDYLSGSFTQYHCWYPESGGFIADKSSPEQPTQNVNLASFLPQSISLCNCKWKWIKIVYLLDRYCIDKKHKLYIHPNCNG